jgi:hypothetical protein
MTEYQKKLKSQINSSNLEVAINTKNLLNELERLQSRIDNSITILKNNEELLQIEFKNGRKLRDILTILEEGIL